MKYFTLLLVALLVSFMTSQAQVTKSKFTKLVWADEFNYYGLPDSSK